MNAKRAVASAAALMIMATAGAAEVELPRASPAASVSLKIGTTKVRIEYSRPGVKGRQIWGGLVPYDTIWRLGANEATTVSFDDPVKVAGQLVPEGTYALFAIPGKESWTMILNRKSDQWGAYFHDAKLDQLRFTVKPRPAPFEEWMVFALDPTGPNGAEIALCWEKLMVAFPIEVDVPGLVWAKLLKELGEKDADWEDFFQAAKYSLDQGGHRDHALGWADRAMTAHPDFWAYELKARLLHREGQTAEALPLLDKAIADAQGRAPAEYIELLKRTRAEWTKQ